MLLTVTALALTLVVPPDAPERKAPASKKELAAITKRGQLLAGYDVAAWHASDALQEKKPKEGSLLRYIARKTDKGWVVAFGRPDDRNDKFLIAYEATQGEDPESFHVEEYDPPKEDTGFLRTAAKAIEVALKDFTDNFQGERRRYNIAVLPADKSQVWVYLVPAPNRPGVWPLGGDVRYLMSADGTKIVEKRQLHKSIIELEPAKEDDPNKLVMGIHTHVLDEIPEDTDVFHVLTRKPAVPELISSEHFVYQVGVDGVIEYLGTPENLFKKK
jgi:hypothetical protein